MRDTYVTASKNRQKIKNTNIRIDDDDGMQIQFRFQSTEFVVFAAWSHAVSTNSRMELIWFVRWFDKIVQIAAISPQSLDVDSISQTDTIGLRSKVPASNNAITEF